jgi:hypothetical protein
MTEQRPQREILVVCALAGASHGNAPLLSPLAEHGERAGVEPKRVAIERCELVHAQAATIQQLEDQLIAAPTRTLDGVAIDCGGSVRPSRQSCTPSLAGRLHHLRGGVSAEHQRQRAARARRGEPFGRIVARGVGARGMSEEGAHAGQLASDRARAMLARQLCQPGAQLELTHVAQRRRVAEPIAEELRQLPQVALVGADGVRRRAALAAQVRHEILDAAIESERGTSGGRHRSLRPRAG